MKTFVYHSLITEENLCNLKSERKAITKGLEQGRKMVVFGRRNTGKTSLVKNIVLKDFKRKHKNAFVMFCDLQGVSSLTDILHRVSIGFQEAFLAAFPVKSKLNEMLETIKGLRPKIELDPIMGVSLSLGVDTKSTQSFVEIFREITKISRNFSTALIFDEFQDVSTVTQAEALLRDVLQNLPHNIPIVILGSKKHLLMKIFTAPNAPFADWGEDIEFSTITYEEYHSYIAERFALHSLTLNKEDSIYLQTLLSRMPEPINIVCATIVDLYSKKLSVISQSEINQALIETLNRIGSRFEEYLKTFTAKEVMFLSQVAKDQPVREPNGKIFVAKTGLSQKGVNLIFHKLENDAIVYVTKEGVELANPLLAHYLRKYR